MATLSTAWRNHIYNLVNRGTAPPSLTTGVFLRLFTADPAGGFGGEVTGGSYTGQNIATLMGAPTNGTGQSTALVSFANMPASTLRFWAKCRSAAATAGADEMIEFGPLSAPVTLSAGETFVVDTGDLTGTVL